MTCERHYTPSAIAEMQAIAQIADLRRGICRIRAKRSELPITEYGSGFIDALDIVLLALEAPAEIRCAGQVQHMQNVALAVELRRRIAHYQEAFKRFQSQNGTMQSMALGMVEVWLDELAPVSQPVE